MFVVISKGQRCEHKLSSPFWFDGYPCVQVPGVLPPSQALIHFCMLEVSLQQHSPFCEHAPFVMCFSRVVSRQ